MAKPCPVVGQGPEWILAKANEGELGTGPLDEPGPKTHAAYLKDRQRGGVWGRMEVEHEFLAQSTPEEVVAMVEAVVTGEPNWVANLANVSAMLNGYLPQINWVGFYLTELTGDELVLGPFQGRPACTRIRRGQGVVGSAAAQKLTIIVPDVNAFPGHIACDKASQAEVVVPMMSPNGDVIGVLDVDSPRVNRFTEDDGRFLESVVAVLARHWDH